jgi:aspartokinase
MYENNQVVAITSHTQVQAIHVQQPDLNSAFATFEGFLKDHEIPLPSILDYQNDQKGFLFYVTATPETLASLIENIRHETALCCHGRPLCTVTLIGGDLSALVLPKKVAQILANADLDIEKMRMDGQSLTIFLGMKDRQTAIRLLHDQLILKESTLTES